MCRSAKDGGRRCSGSRAGSGNASVSAGHIGDMSPGKARLLGVDTPEGAARFERLSALRDSGYTGPIDQDGNAVSETDFRKSPVQRGDKALPGMIEQMREWRSRPEPKPSPAAPMSPQKAKLLGCDTPEGLATFERGRAYREAGYDGPLDKHGNIPDPDDPRERESLHMLAALAETHS